MECNEGHNEIAHGIVFGASVTSAMVFGASVTSCDSHVIKLPRQLGASQDVLGTGVLSSHQRTRALARGPAQRRRTRTAHAQRGGRGGGQKGASGTCKIAARHRSEGPAQQCLHVQRGAFRTFRSSELRASSKRGATVSLLKDCRPNEVNKQPAVSTTRLVARAEELEGGGAVRQLSKGARRRDRGHRAHQAHDGPHKRGLAPGDVLLYAARGRGGGCRAVRRGRQGGVRCLLASAAPSKWRAPAGGPAAERGPAHRRYIMMG